MLKSDFESVFRVIMQMLFSVGEMMELLSPTDLHIVSVDYWEDPSNNHSVLME